MAASVENILSRASLDNLAGVHHADPISHFGDDRQIVGDQNDCHIEPLFKLGHECEDLSLNGDIKGGGRLISDEQLRVTSHGLSNHRAL